MLQQLHQQMMNSSKRAICPFSNMLPGGGGARGVACVGSDGGGGGGGGGTDDGGTDDGGGDVLDVGGEVRRLLISLIDMFLFFNASSSCSILCW